MLCAFLTKPKCIFQHNHVSGTFTVADSNMLWPCSDHFGTMSWGKYKLHLSDYFFFGFNLFLVNVLVHCGLLSVFIEEFQVWISL